MKIIFNDQLLLIGPGTTLSQLLEIKLNHTNAFAIAINHRFVPKEKYETIFLQENDIVHVITPMQGG